MPVILFSQAEKIDLSMIYKIKQEGFKNSTIEELASGLTDFAGPRLTGSTGAHEERMGKEEDGRAWISECKN